MREQTTSRTYEMMVITFPEVEPEALLATPGTLQSYIESAGGSVLKTSNESPWGRRRLAYPIRHQSREIRDGFYTLTYFEAEPDQIAALERDLKLDETTMRYMILHIGEMPTFPEPEPEEGEVTEGEEQSAKEEQSSEAESTADATTSESVDDDTSENETKEDEPSSEGSSDVETEEAAEVPVTEEADEETEDQVSEEEED